MKKLLLLTTVITLSFSCADKATIEFDDPKSQAVLGLFLIVVGVVLVNTFSGRSV